MPTSAEIAKLAAQAPVLSRGAGFRYAGVRSQVRRLQRALGRHGYAGLSGRSSSGPDGLYGRYTRAAVRHFQHMRGVSPSDGTCREPTWRVLLAEPKKDVHWSKAWHATGYGRTLLPHVKRAEAYRAAIEAEARKNELPAAVIAGVGSRESGWGIYLTPRGPAGTGDSGHGHGLMQIDDRYHEFARSGEWQNATANIAYGAELLRQYIDRMEDYSRGGLMQLRAGLAAYNGGPGDVRRALRFGRDPDTETTGGDYSRDVLSRAGYFQRHGWL